MGEGLGWGRGGKGEGEEGEVEGREREGPQVTFEPGPLRALLYATDKLHVRRYLIHEFLFAYLSFLPDYDINVIFCLLYYSSFQL